MVTDLVVSVIVRTMNEQRWLLRTLSGLRHQKDTQGNELSLQIIVVDSGSTDTTIELLSSLEWVDVYELKQKPYFPGKAINYGLSKAKGEVVVVLSAHCVPTDEFSISKLIAPIIAYDDVVASYGRQIPMESSSADDARDLIMTFRNEDKIQTLDGFIHNAFAAYSKTFLKKNKFDETVKHVEDMVWGRNNVTKDSKICYVSEAKVYHHHGLHQHQKNKSFRASGVRSYLENNYKIDCPAWLKPKDYKIATLLYGNNREPNEIIEILNKTYPLECFCFSDVFNEVSDPRLSIIYRSKISKSKNFKEFLQDCISDVWNSSGKLYEVFILVDLEYLEKQYNALKVNLENVCEKGYDGSFVAVQENHQLVYLDAEGSIISHEVEDEAKLAKLCFGQFGVVTLDALSNIMNIEKCAVALQIETKKEIGIRYAQ